MKRTMKEEKWRYIWLFSHGFSSSHSIANAWLAQHSGKCLRLIECEKWFKWLLSILCDLKYFLFGILTAREIKCERKYYKRRWLKRTSSNVCGSSTCLNSFQRWELENFALAAMIESPLNVSKLSFVFGFDRWILQTVNLWL